MKTSYSVYWASWLYFHNGLERMRRCTCPASGLPRGAAAAPARDRGGRGTGCRGRQGRGDLVRAQPRRRTGVGSAGHQRFEAANPNIKINLVACRGLTSTPRCKP